MARTIDAKCRICRRNGTKLFLKGDRCFSQKCGMVKRAYAPGAQGKSGGKARRRSFSEFGQQLTQKQHVKQMYGIMERQLKKYFNEALAQKGDTRENLLRRLETRLDNAIFRLGWAKSRSAARQLVSHGHVLVNNKKVSIPSYQVRPGELVSMNERIKKSRLNENLTASLKKYETPSWLFVDKEKIEAKILHQPSLDDLGDLTPLGLIIESYSR